MEGLNWLWVIGIAGLIGVIWFVGFIYDLYSSRSRVEEEKILLQKEKTELADKISEWEKYDTELEKLRKQLNYEQELFRKLFEERTKNYPVVGQIWSDLINITDEEREKTLRYKSRPAIKAAEEIKKIKSEKRELVKDLVYWKYKSQNYEAIYPWLAEELERDISDEVQAELYYNIYSEEERKDPVTQFITPEDYRKLSVSQRNQLALDRYWRRGKKSKWMIGKMYERYVGYLYEKNNWDVDYFGIHKRFEDLGRDLIARKGKEIHVVQCKNWSKFKTIYENHIFQLFGTTYGLGKEKDNKGKKVVAVFYCSTSLSETALEFARRLGIKVFQNHAFREYPAIKCNIAPGGEKIYHLPFDQQYDKVKITPKTGEFYAKNVKEAESKGFRRAFRWRGHQEA